MRRTLSRYLLPPLFLLLTLRFALWVITEEAKPCPVEDVGLVREVGLENYTRHECAGEEADFGTTPTSSDEWIALDGVGVAASVFSEAYVENDLVKMFVLSAADEPRLYCSGRQCPFDCFRLSSSFRHALMLLCRTDDLGLGHVVVAAQPCQGKALGLKLRRSKTKHHSSNSDGIILCSHPLSKHKDLSLEVLEWIELNLLLGADHIVVYAGANVTTSTWLVLYYASSVGRVSVVDWAHVADGNNGDGFSALALAHCVAKFAGKNDIVVNTALTEVLLPRGHSSWSALFSTLNEDFGAMSLSDVHFCNKWNGRPYDMELWRIRARAIMYTMRPSIPSGVLTLPPTTAHVSQYAWGLNRRFGAEEFAATSGSADCNVDDEYVERNLGAQLIARMQKSLLDMSYLNYTNRN